MEGITVVEGKKNEEIKWEVIESCTEDYFSDKKMKNADLIDWFNDRGSKKLSDALLLLWPGDIWAQLEEMNKHIRENVNVENKKNSKRIIAPVVKSELLTFIALLIASASTATVG